MGHREIFLDHLAIKVLDILSITFIATSNKDVTPRGEPSQCYIHIVRRASKHAMRISCKTFERAMPDIQRLPRAREDQTRIHFFAGNGIDSQAVFRMLVLPIEIACHARK